MATTATKLYFTAGGSIIVLSSTGVALYMTSSSSRAWTPWESSNSSFGSNYPSLLVSPTDVSSKAWWEERYEELKEENNLSPQFTNLEKGWSEEAADQKALNNLCKTIYTSPDPFYTIKESEYYLFIENFWKYCSGVRTKPLTVFEANEHSLDDSESSTETMNSIGTYADHLAATKTEKNNYFWEIKEAWYLATQDPNKVIFSDWMNKKQIEFTTLKDACYLAYSEETSSFTSTEVKAVLNICSASKY